MRIRKIIFLILISAACLPASRSCAQGTASRPPAQGTTSRSSDQQTNSPSSAPKIKKLKVTELEEYIRQCTHPLVVSLWATYCTPCVKEIPYFQSTVARYQEKEVEWLMVSLDPPGFYPERIAAFARKENISATLVWLNETNPGYFRPLIDSSWSGGLPASLFINNQTHYHHFFDRQLTDRQVEQEIRLLVTPAPVLARNPAP